MTLSLSRLRRFRQEEGGSVIAEAVIVLPMFLWAYLALFVFWDAFRSMNTVQKAAYTVSDTISREMSAITPAYVDGLASVMDFLLDDDQDVKMRVTSITYDEDTDRFIPLWSYSPGNTLPEMTEAMLNQPGNRARIPNLADADFATILETEVNYEAAFEVGLGERTFQQFIVTRPRFVAPTCMTGRPCTS